MSIPLRVLLIERADDEALPVIAALRQGGYEPAQARVETADALREALQRESWDLIVAAPDVPQLSAMAALAVRRELDRDTPFIVVPEQGVEEQAVELMRAGANDLIPKRDLVRLAPAVRRELHEAETRRERRRAETALRESEARFRRIVETASEGIWELGADERTTYVNQQAADMLGYTREEMVGRPLFQFMDEADIAYAKQCIARRQPGSTHRDEFHYRRKDGGDLWALVGTQPVMDSQGRQVGALGMLTDITARKRIEEERKELLGRERVAREAAEEASAAKDRFLALLSHELRNPLAPVMAGIPVLRRALPADARARDTLDIMERNIRVQARLVTDLLDLTAIVRGQVQLTREPLRLDTVARAAVQAHEEEATRAGLSLQCHLDSRVWVQGDAARLQRAAESLLSNAIRFTPEGGSLRVAVRECPEAAPGGEGAPPTAGVAYLTVEDSGIGIDPAAMPRLFEMFQRGETGGWRTPGLGIGLALVRSIAEAHGGRVWAESEGTGRGSCFTIELPLLRSVAAAVPEKPAGPSKEASILLVESDPDTRVLLSDSLDLLGFEVRAAESGEAALAMIRQTPPAALLVDISLPGVDAEFLRQARELPGMAEVPAFAITGYGSDEDVRHSQEAGYTGHVAKPVDVHTLEERLRERVPAGRV